MLKAGLASIPQWAGVFLLAFLAAVPSPTMQATATVRIERPVKVSRDEWEKLPSQSKREVVITDEQGRRLLLRVVENQ
jgi:hypothetical protein